MLQTINYLPSLKHLTFACHIDSEHCDIEEMTLTMEELSIITRLETLQITVNELQAESLFSALTDYGSANGGSLRQIEIRNEVGLIPQMKLLPPHLRTIVTLASNFEPDLWGATLRDYVQAFPNLTRLSLVYDLNQALLNCLAELPSIFHLHLTVVSEQISNDPMEQLPRLTAIKILSLTISDGPHDTLSRYADKLDWIFPALKCVSIHYRNQSCGLCGYNLQLSPGQFKVPWRCVRQFVAPLRNVWPAAQSKTFTVQYHPGDGNYPFYDGKGKWWTF